MKAKHIQQKEFEELVASSVMVQTIETVRGCDEGGDGGNPDQSPETLESPKRAAERKEISILPVGDVFWLKPDCFGDREG